MFVGGVDVGAVEEEDKDEEELEDDEDEEEDEDAVGEAVGKTVSELEDDDLRL